MEPNGKRVNASIMSEKQRPPDTDASGMLNSLKKSTAELLVLFMLRQKSMYTYQILSELTRLTDGALTFNTLYLAIYRLEEKGYVREKEKRIEGNRTRVYFALTESGQHYLDALRTEYSRYTTAMQKLLAQDGQIYTPSGGEQDG